MSRLNYAVGILLLLAGAIWVLQGFNVAFAPESFMTDDPMWIIWGAVAILVGFGLIWRARIR